MPKKTDAEPNMKDTDGLRTTLPVHPLLAGRYSPRAFSDRGVEDSDLDLVFEAARLAPSSRNEQPWRFLVARRGGEGHDGMLNCLLPGNRAWAEKAPVLILTMVSRAFVRNGDRNVHAWHDLGLAIGQLTVQAAALGMGLRQLGGFRPEPARVTFGIPDEYDLVSVIALGYPGDPALLPEELRIREEQRSPRRPLRDILWRGRVGG